MDFGTLLSIHSIIRWIILFSIILVLYKSYKGLKQLNAFSWFDTKLRIFTPILCWIQFVLGLTLYSKSAIVSYFFEHLPETLSQREIRFFGLEHSTAMPLAIIFISIAAYKSIKHQSNLEHAYKTWFRWSLAGFILIITSIPWSFWPLVSRPLFREF